MDATGEPHTFASAETIAVSPAIAGELSALVRRCGI
jgi:hypothetical protein